MAVSDIEHCKIVSLNVRGLNKSIKRRSIFRWFHKQNAHFYMLQETYSDKKNYSHMGTSRGVAKLYATMGQNTVKA